jgi:hypothetical protein
MSSFRSAVAPLIVVALMTPVLIILVMLVVAYMMTPALIQLVSLRRFAAMENRCTDSRWITVWVTVSSTALALVLLILSVPLWFVPPLFFLLPPLIWGRLNYRVMSFDALLGHASKTERMTLLKQHRTQLLLIGIATGYMGAMPSMIWALGSMAAVFAVVLLPIAIWLYTLVFAFSTLWFIHYCLAALEQHRAAQATQPANQPAAIETLTSIKEITHA